MTELDNDRVSSGEVEQTKPHFSRSLTGSALSAVLVLFIVALIATDYASIIFADKRKRVAQDLIKPGMRLTQAERTLNGAGYMTLYIEARPPMLQVSTLSRFPLTADLLHKALPHSTPDLWLRSALSVETRFYLVGESDGTVQFQPEGKPMVYDEEDLLVGQLPQGF